MSRTQPIVPGDRFGKLEIKGDGPPVIRVSKDKVRTDLRVHTKCECGNETLVFTKHLRSGATTSCGCGRIERRRGRVGRDSTYFVHGRSKTPEYETWHGMLQRCFNSNAPNWDRYGGRGITVCDRWREAFLNFFEDMGERPDGTSIDRIDNDGDYEPSNCRWAPAHVQRANQSAGMPVRLNPDAVRLIRSAANAGQSQASLAREWGVSRSTISDAVERRTWVHVR